MPLLEVLRPEGRPVATQRVAAFDPAEPDPALFRIPDGYKVSDAPPPPEPAPGTVRIGGNVSAPRVLSAPEPEFSEEARRSRISGNVLVYLVIDESGLPQDVKVIRGLGHGLDEKAVEAVSKYRFKPAMRDGVPVKVEMHVEVNFQIFTRP
jgi:TonB family protein